jgi:hypothetical protein
MMLIRTRLAIAAALFAGGCSHAIILTPQDGVGPIGRGSAPAQLVSYHGGLSVELAGKTYSGEYTLKSEGGSVGYGFGNLGGKIVSGTVVGMPTEGNGRAYLTEPGGGSLSCVFSYNSMSATGLGGCRTDAGKVYDMQIR